MLEASVARIRSSASSKAFGRSSSTHSTPTTWLPLRIGTPSQESETAPRLMAPSASPSASVPMRNGWRVRMTMEVRPWP